MPLEAVVLLELQKPSSIQGHFEVDFGGFGIGERTSGPLFGRGPLFWLEN